MKKEKEIDLSQDCFEFVVGLLFSVPFIIIVALARDGILAHDGYFFGKFHKFFQK